MQTAGSADQARTTRGPLAGVRVLDLCTVGPGARAAALLADLGADVVKVGPPASAGRIVAADWAYSAGRGTQRIGINLKDPAGRDAFLAMARGADVVMEGFRPGAAARLGLGFEDIRAVNDRVVYVSLTGFGQDGPYAQWAGHDVNYQAVGGVLALQGRDAAGVPALPGATWADSAGGGFHAALSICAALVTPAGQRQAVHLDVSATDGVVSAMSLMLDEHLATGIEHRPGTSILTGRFACYGVYACSDDRHVAVGAIEPVFWANLCRLMQLDQYAELQRDDDRQDEIRVALTARFLTRPRDEWVALLSPANTCVSPVLAPDEVVRDEHLVARASVTDVVMGNDGASTRQTARVIAGSVRTELERGVPVKETSTAELLQEAGLESAVIESLMQTGVVQ